MVIPAYPFLLHLIPSVQGGQPPQDLSEEVHLHQSLLTKADISRGSRRWMWIALPPTAVTLHHCTPPAVGPLPIGIRASCCTSLYRSLPPRMVATDILPTVTIPTSLHPGRSDLHQRRLPLSRAATPPERPHTPVTPPNARLPPASVTPRGLHDLTLWRLLIETVDVRIENGIVNVVADICRSILPLRLIRCLLLEPIPLPIVVIALVLVLLATTAHLNHLQGTFISQFPADRTLPHGLKINPLRLAPLLLIPSLSLTHLGGMIRGTTVGIQGK